MKKISFDFEKIWMMDIEEMSWKIRNRSLYRILTYHPYIVEASVSNFPVSSVSSIIIFLQSTNYTASHLCNWRFIESAQVGAFPIERILCAIKCDLGGIKKLKRIKIQAIHPTRLSLSSYIFHFRIFVFIRLFKVHWPDFQLYKICSRTVMVNEVSLSIELVPFHWIIICSVSVPLPALGMLKLDWHWCISCMQLISIDS